MNNSGRRVSIWILAAVLAAGLSVRLLYLREIMGRPDFTHPSVDGAYHDYWARGIATGDWSVPGDYQDPLIRERAYFRPPGYAYALALVYSLFGHGYLVPRLMQMGMGLVSCLLAFLFARRWFGDRTGIVYAGLMAFYWIFIYFESKLLDAVVDVFFTVLLLLLLADWLGKVSFRSGLIRGAVLSLFSLFRPNVLLFWPAAVVWLLWVRHAHKDKKPLTRCAAGFLLGTVLALVPVFARNVIVARDPVLISANGGMSLAIGNNELADGTNHYLPGFGIIGTPFDYTRAVLSLEKSLGRSPGSLRYSEASSLFARKALDFILLHPLSFLRLTLRKAALFWGPFEVTNNEEIYFARKNSPILRAIPLNFPLVFALGVLGAVLFLLSCNVQRATCNGPPPIQQFSVAVLILLFIAVYFLSALPFAAADRYRVPVIPCLLLFSALGLLSLFDFLRRKDFVRFGVTAGVGIIAYLLLGIDLTGYQPSPAKWHYDAALASSAEGRTEEAIAEYRNALAAAPEYVEARNNLGALLVGRGRWEEAIVEYREVLRLRPDRAEMHSNLGDVLSRMGRDEEAIVSFREAIRLDPECVQAHNNLAILLEKLGKHEEAIGHYDAAIRARPDYEQAHYNLANLLLRMGDAAGAIAHFREAVRLDPRYAPAYNNLGNALAGRGRAAEAAEEYRKALAIDPSLLDAHNNLANILAGEGKYAEAIEHYRRALEIDPSYGMAHLNLGYTLEVQGRRPEALEHYRQALRLMPENVQVHLKLAAALAADGKREEARELIRRALVLDPNSAAAREALGKIVISDQ